MSVPAAQEEAAALEVIRLRRQMTLGTAEPWAAALPAGFDTRLLHHLPPPPAPASPGPQGDDPGLTLWRSAFRPGLCYHRRGPGFVQVKDVRDARSAAWITLDQEPLIEAFLRCCDQPVSLAGQDGNDRAALEVLLRENLLLQFGELVTAAPYHMKYWPIPARFA
jgi:hypothetical protein